jgi:hypothetical protein
VEPPAPDPQDAQTLAEVLREFEAEGYAVQLVAEEGGTVHVSHREEHVDAAGLVVDHARRTEGASDPDDMELVVAARLPDGTRGTLVLGYGPVASSADADVLAKLDLRNVR